MKEIRLYTCDFCNTSYSDKSKAIECEENHKKIKKICDTKYLAYKADMSGKPQKVCVEFEDDSTEWYHK